jgi:hypothetical protein
MDEALTRHADLVATLRRAVFESPGETAPRIRRAAGNGGSLPKLWGATPRRCGTTPTESRTRTSLR